MIKYETNSKLVKPGQIFVAIKGSVHDGHDFIKEAIKNGAKKIVLEKKLKLNTPYKIVKSTKEYINKVLVKEYSKKIKKIKIIAVTGTNGKTTTCFLIYQLFQELGIKSAYIGTLGYYRNEYKTHLNNTTPDILTLYKLILDAQKNECEYIVMEVSSHALALKRIAGLKFIAAAFTNLTEDHLDYHKTMEAYLKEKIKIINYLDKDAVLIINSDDNYSDKFIEKWNNYKTFGFNGNYKIEKYKIEADHTNLEFSFSDKKYSVTTNLTSVFNIYNYLASIGILNSLGFDINTLIKITNKVFAPKGRCETYKVNNGFAIIDYAHTPDAVKKVIEAYSEFKKSRIITIIGCGGDRDPLKRPIMGNIATNLSDYVIFTNDNPRTEDPKLIIKDIINGISKNNYEIIYDRENAITKGIQMMNDNDILLVLGKGHENYQIIGNKKIHFDDSQIIKKYIKKS